LDKFKLLDHKEEINKIDREGMLGVVSKTPELLVSARELAPKGSLPKIKKIKHIVVCGMGGSAIAGNILADLLLDKVNVPIYINRNYKLPSFVGKDTLVFALSYSGNTEETLSAVACVAKAQARIICITSGGKLKKLAEEKRYPYYLIPAGYQPRAALPYLLVPFLNSLDSMGIIAETQKGLDEAIILLKKLREEYGVDCPLRNNPVKQLGQKLLAKIPFIFATTGTTAAGLRFKTQFNENSKMTALFNVFPELNHNEIVNLSVLKRAEHNFALLFLRDEEDNERIKKRMEITKSLLGRQLGGVHEVWSRGKFPLARILSLIYFGDFLSVYLALLQEIDPTPVAVISRLKRELSR